MPRGLNRAFSLFETVLRHTGHDSLQIMVIWINAWPLLVHDSVCGFV